MTGWLFAALLLAPAAAGAAEPVMETIEFEGRARQYALYVPPALPPGPAPLVLLLHGSYGSGLAMVQRWQRLADEEHFIVVGPDASEREHWRVPHDCPEFIYAVTRQARTRHDVDGRRQYLFGYSAGGEVALTVAMLESRYYAATATFGAAWKSAAEAAPLDLARRRMPFALAFGQHDAAVPSGIAFTRKLYEDRGFPVEILLIPRQGHGYAAVASQVNRWAWEFFEKHRLEGEPVHSQYLRPGGG